MLKHITILSAALLISASASAFSGISAKFDGTYKGTAEVVPASSAPSCAPLALDQVNIKAGQLSSGSGALQVSGFVTAEGYIDAALKPVDGTKAKMDGRLEGDAISAGAIDPAKGCSWIVRLYKAD